MTSNNQPAAAATVQQGCYGGTAAHIESNDNSVMAQW